MEGSYRHLLTDLYAFAGTALAGLVIWTTGFERADPIASLAVAASMLAAAVAAAAGVGARAPRSGPGGDRPERGRRGVLRSHHGVTDVHDLHVWEISSGFPALSAHVLVERGEDCHRIRRELEHELGDRYGIDHTTLQVEHTSDRLLSIEPLRTSRRGPLDWALRAAPSMARAEATRPHHSLEWRGLFSFSTTIDTNKE